MYRSLCKIYKKGGVYIHKSKKGKYVEKTNSKYDNYGSDSKRRKTKADRHTMKQVLKQTY